MRTSERRRGAVVPTTALLLVAVVSFLVPSGPFDSGVIESFCHFVHFFASRQAGEQWVTGHPGTFLLTLGEAAHLAARGNQRMFPDALGAR